MGQVAIMVLLLKTGFVWVHTPELQYHCQPSPLAACETVRSTVLNETTDPISEPEPVHCKKFMWAPGLMEKLRIRLNRMSTTAFAPVSNTCWLPWLKSLYWSTTLPAPTIVDGGPWHPVWSKLLCDTFNSPLPRKSIVPV